MMENASVVTLLTLTGLDFTLEYKITLFLLTLLWYFIILLGNISIIVAIVVDKNLHEPMYIFLCNLCINALYGTLGFYPKFLVDLLSSHVISYAGCMLQGFVIHSSICCDFSILALMAYDRYLAICQPLTYHSFMTKQRVTVFVFFSWLIPLYCMFMNTATLLGSSLCGSHVKKIYCVNWMIFTLTCSPPAANIGVTYFNLLFYLAHFFFIIWTYVYLIRTCLRSTESWGRFMQTCMPHVISLATFSISVLLDILYMRFGSPNLSQDLSNFMAMEFLLIPPAVNPFVYGFKLTKIHNKFVNLVYIKRKVSNCQPMDYNIKSELSETAT
ncbi:olfactory receptor 49-like [Hippoglossus stenolepis]|uniref:olfactory receptor 49-like n=1 Tax=Hippoglossus stenolepis TaxID=195615 RepID=UPI00159C8F5E|nr:olfactory receptor 49-like [Hippoglossus stenolepis]